MSRPLNNLQALRGVACLLVVGFHATEWERLYGISTPVFGLLRHVGFAGVDLFFVLSGFIITHAHAAQLGRPQAAPAYLLRRAWRLLPVYWVMMGLAGAALTLALKWPLFDPGWGGRWGRWMLLLPADAPNTVLPPAWSLSYELAFYLVFAGLFLVPPRWGIGLLTGWGAAVLVAAGLLGPDARDPYTAILLGPLVLEFLFGAAVAGLVRHGVTRAGGWLLLLGVIGFAVGAWTLTPAPLSRVAGFGIPAALIVYGLVATELRGGRPAPGWLRRTGDASYSVYLWHYPTGMLAVTYGCFVPHTRGWHLFWLAGTLAVCVGGGVALHRLVERPLMRLARRERRPEEPILRVPEPAAVRKAA